jgi:hypothetical protein
MINKLINFDHNIFVSYMQESYYIPISSISLYVFFCYFGPIVMKNYNAFDLTYELSLWNGFLAIFSLLGAINTLPYVVEQFDSLTYKDTICINPKYVPTSNYSTWLDDSAGIWVFLFAISKIPELIDTVFIILRKKPLIFLHWYHHATILYTSWDAYANHIGSGLYFATMNYCIHTIMYSYYCARSMEICPKNFPSYIITILQTVQMFVGASICLTNWYYIVTDKSCYHNINSLLCCTTIFISYFYLFYSFGVKRYIKKQV